MKSLDKPRDYNRNDKAAYLKGTPLWAEKRGIVGEAPRKLTEYPTQFLLEQPCLPLYKVVTDEPA